MDVHAQIVGHVGDTTAAAVALQIALPPQRIGSMRHGQLAQQFASIVIDGIVRQLLRIVIEIAVWRVLVGCSVECHLVLYVQPISQSIVYHHPRTVPVAHGAFHHAGVVVIVQVQHVPHLVDTA